MMCRKASLESSCLVEGSSRDSVGAAFWLALAVFDLDQHELRHVSWRPQRRDSDLVSLC